MILVFTDFGLAGPYVGQMRAVLASLAPGVPAIDLMHDAPAFRPKEAGYLLAALVRQSPAGSVILGVVDPGVGTARRPIVLRLGQRWLVGPDNGLFAAAARQAREEHVLVEAWAISWRPAALSTSFHGRDLFAPVAAGLARSNPVPGDPVAPGSLIGIGDQPDLPAIVYVDGYGNAMTGLRTASLPSDVRIRAGGRMLCRAETFGSVPSGDAFWYENSSGLAELSVNQGSAQSVLRLTVGSPLEVVSATSESWLAPRT